MRDSQNGCLSFENLNLKWMITRGTPMAEETSNWPATNISTRSTACLSPVLLIIASSSLALPSVGADDTAQCNNGADLPGCWMVLSFCFDMCHMPVPVTVLQHVIKYFEQYVCIYIYIYMYTIPVQTIGVPRRNCEPFLPICVQSPSSKCTNRYCCALQNVWFGQLRERLSSNLAMYSCSCTQSIVWKMYNHVYIYIYM